MSDRILYCHCAFAKVVPADVKCGVLERLTASGRPFEAVPDLCELSARNDPQLAALATGDGPLRIAACYPRAVRWLFAAGGQALPAEGVAIHNMRTDDAETVAGALLQESR